MGMTPLHLAAEKGYLETVRVLVENKADSNCRDNVRLLSSSLFRLQLLL